MKTWLIRSIKFLVVVEVVYLVIVNGCLNLPLTQVLINKIKPDTFTVSWSSGWSLYPFRVHARDIAGNGQSKSQQWQVASPAATASISLVPLLSHTVKLDGIEAEDIVYKQRPRPKPQKDYAETRPYFPDIEGRELETNYVEPAPSKEKSSNPWKIEITNITARGTHQVWLYQVQGRLSGTLQVDLEVEPRGGLFALANGEVNFDSATVTINNDQQVIKDGQIEGNVSFHPFVFQENKGMRAIAFMNIDATLQAETDRLRFLNYYLANFHGMEVDGTGLVKGRLHLSQGMLEDGSDIQVAAPNLSVDILDQRLEGSGDIDIKTSGTENTEVVVSFSRLEAFDTSRDMVLFDGGGVSVEAQSSRSILTAKENPFEARRLTVSIPEVTVPDIKVFQTYLPEKRLFMLHGGNGTLQGTFELTPTGLNNNLRLTSKNAELGFKKYRFSSNLDMAIKIDSPTIDSGLDFTGSYIHLDGAQVSNNRGQISKPWFAAMDLTQGKINLTLPGKRSANKTFRELYHELRGKETISTLFDTADQPLILDSSLSDLSWLTLFMNNRFGFGITGSGEITTTLNLEQGLPAPGTSIAIKPERFGVDILDYSAEGNGSAALMVTRGGKTPDVDVSVKLSQGLMHRKEDEQSFIENVDMILQASIRNFSLDQVIPDMSLHFQIPRAEITDMSAYNQYLPPKTPLQITGGTADLQADLQMTPDTAEGFVKLRTADITAHVEDQDITGDLTADITLTDGIPDEMYFDLSGSTLVLDKVRIAGSRRSHDDDNWATRFTMKKAHTTWKKPINIEVDADLEMSDSKPIVAVMANKRGKHGWIEKAATIDHFSGEASFSMKDNELVIPYAFATSDKIDVGAKGVITRENQGGVFYLRFRKLHGILKMLNGDRNLDVIRARDKFDEYDSKKELLDFKFSH